MKLAGQFLWTGSHVYSENLGSSPVTLFLSLTGCFNKGRSECRECSKKTWKERYHASKNHHEDLIGKTCSLCNTFLPIKDFNKKAGSADGYRNECKTCINKRRQEWRYRRGDNKSPSRDHAWNVWFGIEIGEEIASRYFDNPTRMPYGNPGYDLICKNGFTINVKMAIQRDDRRWTYALSSRSGVGCDYYMLIAMSDRDTLEPLHVWLIPSNAVVGRNRTCDKGSLSVSPSTLSKLAEYEKPVGHLQCCCQSVRVTA